MNFFYDSFYFCHTITPGFMILQLADLVFFEKARNILIILRVSITVNHWLTALHDKLVLHLQPIPHLINTRISILIFVVIYYLLYHMIIN